MKWPRTHPNGALQETAKSGPRAERPVVKGSFNEYSYLFFYRGMP